MCIWLIGGAVEELMSMYSRVECEQQNSGKPSGQLLSRVQHELCVSVVGHKGSSGICGLARVRCTWASVSMP
jgi:hypothetical protein